MKILFLTPWYPDERQRNHGIFVQQQALAISELHQVVVISSKVDYSAFGFCKYSLTETDNGRVKEYRMLIKRSLPIYNQLNYFLLSTWIALKISKAFKPDLIHGNIGYPGAFWSWLVSRRLKKAFVVTEHTLLHNNFRSAFHKTLTCFALKKANAIITVSSFSSQVIKRYVDKRVDVIPNLIDVTKFSVKPLSGRPVTIGFLGDLNSPIHKKGLDVFLESVSKIEGEFICLIGGEGRLKEQYIKMAEHLGIKDKCIFRGFISPEQVPDFMNQLHIFVNSSKFESFGIAIIEAMASGVPVVCFNNGGPSDFVNDFNGMLVQNGDVQELTKAIKKMMSAFSQFDSQKIREYVVKRFSTQAFAERTLEVYNRVLKKDVQ